MLFERFNHRQNNNNNNYYRKKFFDLKKNYDNFCLINFDTYEGIIKVIDDFLKWCSHRDLDCNFTISYIKYKDYLKSQFTNKNEK